uniref:Uncharacterized protein n=1 Tax=Mycena chlorophos TaxID=658473 RepID=A0ABQ0L0I2_MYCCL|nr:predicted protein [Mycena chlorophos]
MYTRLYARRASCRLSSRALLECAPGRLCEQGLAGAVPGIRGHWRLRDRERSKLCPHLLRPLHIVPCASFRSKNGRENDHFPCLYTPSYNKLDPRRSRNPSSRYSTPFSRRASAPASFQCRFRLAFAQKGASGPRWLCSMMSRWMSFGRLRAWWCRRVCCLRASAFLEGMRDNTQYRRPSWFLAQSWPKWDPHCTFGASNGRIPYHFACACAFFEAFEMSPGRVALFRSEDDRKNLRRPSPCLYTSSSNRHDPRHLRCPSSRCPAPPYCLALPPSSVDCRSGLAFALSSAFGRGGCAAGRQGGCRFAPVECGGTVGCGACVCVPTTLCAGGCGDLTRNSCRLPLLVRGRARARWYRPTVQASALLSACGTRAACSLTRTRAARATSRQITRRWVVSSTRRARVAAGTLSRRECKRVSFGVLMYPSLPLHKSSDTLLRLHARQDDPTRPSPFRPGYIRVHIHDDKDQNTSAPSPNPPLTSIPRMLDARIHHGDSGSPSRSGAELFVLAVAVAVQTGSEGRESVGCGRSARHSAGGRGAPCSLVVGKGGGWVVRGSARDV